MPQIRNVIDFITLINKDKTENKTLYLPYHKLFWQSNYTSTNYLIRLSGDYTTLKEINDLLTISPFKVIPIDLLCTEYTQERIVVKVEVEKGIDLLALLYDSYWPMRYYYNKDILKDRIDNLVRTFNLDYDPRTPNKLSLRIPSYLTRYFFESEAKLRGEFSWLPDIKDIFRVSVPLFTDEESAYMSIIDKLKKITTNTVSSIKRNSKKILLDSSFQPTKSLVITQGTYVTSNDEVDTALMRKVLFRAQCILPVLSNTFKKNVKNVIKSQTFTQENLDNCFDYDQWNSLLRDLTMFKLADKKKRFKYFKTHLKNNINERERSKTSNCVSE